MTQGYERRNNGQVWPVCLRGCQLGGADVSEEAGLNSWLAVVTMMRLL